MYTKERKEAIKKQVGNATSLMQLEAEQEAFNLSNQLNELTYKFFTVMDNILFDNTVTDKKASIKSLTTEYTTMLDEIPLTNKNKNPLSLPVRVKNWLGGVDTKKDVYVFKGLDGNNYLFGKPTNFFEDREGETLKGSAHEDYIKNLDAGIIEPPELWIWHEEKTAFENKAVWWDFADGSLQMVWHLTSNETEKLKQFLDRYDAGMSHGFNGVRDEKNNQIFNSYTMKEASILPKEFAANSLADFSLINVETKKMFTPEKRQALSIFLTDDQIKDIEENNEKSKQNAILNGVPFTKEKEGEKMQKDDTVQDNQEDTVETTEELVETTEDVTNTDYVTIQDLQTFADAITANIDLKLEAISKQIKQKEETKRKNLSRSEIIAQMVNTNGVSSISNSKPIDESDKEFNEKHPQEASNNGRGTNLMAFSRK